MSDRWRPDLYGSRPLFPKRVAGGLPSMSIVHATRVSFSGSMASAAWTRDSAIRAPGRYWLRRESECHWLSGSCFGVAKRRAESSELMRAGRHQERSWEFGIRSTRPTRRYSGIYRPSRPSRPCAKVPTRATRCYIAGVAKFFLRWFTSGKSTFPVLCCPSKACSIDTYHDCHVAIIWWLP